MRSVFRLLSSEPLLQAKAAIVAFTPLLAHAAGEQLALRAESLSPTTWFFIVLFSLLGWIVSDLDKVAELWNLEGKTLHERVRARLVLAKTVGAALLAGVCMFFLGKLAPGVLLGMLGVAGGARELPEMGLLIGTAVAGYMGARFFDWLERRLTGTSRT